jgi:hypothetical protein
MVHQYSNIIVILLLSQSNSFEILLSTNVVCLPYKEYARHYKYGIFLALKILIKDESFENFVLRRKTLDQNFQSQKSTIIYCCFYYVCISNMIITYHHMSQHSDKYRISAATRLRQTLLFHCINSDIETFTTAFIVIVFMGNIIICLTLH